MFKQAYIRAMEVADLAEVVAIEENGQFTPWSEDIFRECLKVGYQGLILEKEQTIYGFAVFSLVHDECHVLNICIDTRFQRQGYGQYLFTELLAMAKKAGASTVSLEVRRSNKPAIALYQHFAFQLISQRKNYYPSKNGREDALIFTKHL